MEHAGVVQVSALVIGRVGNRYGWCCGGLAYFQALALGSIREERREEHCLRVVRD